MSKKDNKSSSKKKNTQYDSSSVRYYIPRGSSISKITGFIALLAFIIHFIIEVIYRLIEKALVAIILFTARSIRNGTFAICRGIAGVGKFIGHTFIDCVHGFTRNCNIIHDGFFACFLSCDRFNERVGAAWREKKSSAVPTALKLTRIGMYNNRRRIASVMNVIIPIIAIGIFALTVNYWTNKQYGLILTYNDEQIATIEYESEFEQASTMVSSRLVHSNTAETLKIVPKYTLTTLDSGKFAKAHEVSDIIISKSTDSIVSAVGYYADGVLIGAMETEDELDEIENEIKSEELKRFTSKSSYSNIKAVFAEKIDKVAGLYPTATVYDKELMGDIMRKKQPINIYYTAEEGDTLDTVMAKTGLSEKVLNRLNPDINFNEDLLANTKVVTSSRMAELTLQVTADKQYMEDIPYKTVTKYDDTEHVDYLVVTRDGVNGRQRCVDTLTFENGKLVNTKKKTRTVTKKPISKVQIKGTIEYLYGHAYGELIWPLPYTHNITSYFEWRWGRMHRGLDIADSGCYGANIVAADGGVVEVAEYVWDYGNYIIIYHKDGMRTLYGHCSQLYVSAGEEVYQGQVIAAVGETGEAYGAHLHFEVRINYGDNRVDPLDYL